MRAVLLFRRSVIIAVAGMVVLGCAVYFGIDATVNRAVSADADHKARGWAAYFIEHMPNLDELIATGRPDANQLERIATAEKVGDVFRFKLFDRRGVLTLVSDESTFTMSEDGNADALEVMRTGISNVSLNDGTGKKNRPPLYVEAYVPFVDGNGIVRGVVEVYIDQTQTASLFKTTFAALAIGLALVAALAFGLPTMAYLLRSRQASEARQRAEYLAHYEPMTGLLNRASFTGKLESALQGGESLTLVFLDLDDFKMINETHGHEAGDEFLKHVANCITQLCGETDIVARPGGDEFLLALAGRSGPEVTALVQQLMQGVGQPIFIGGKSISAKLSAGIYMVNPDVDAMADAMQKAEVALFQAKLDGRNTYRLFSEDLENSMRARRELEQLIRKTAEQETFELHYQPLVQADNGACVGFEALLRLPNGRGGYIPPTTCVPVIEVKGMSESTKCYGPRASFQTFLSRTIGRRWYVGCRVGGTTCSHNAMATKWFREGFAFISVIPEQTIPRSVTPEQTIPKFRHPGERYLNSSPQRNFSFAETKVAAQTLNKRDLGKPGSRLSPG